MKIELGTKNITLRQIARLSDTSLRADCPETEITHIATDSREVSEGTLFLGIRGERVDGNRFAPIALENGASAVLCETLPESGEALRADDTVLALGRLATAYRKHIGKDRIPTVAVTGSVGKTTTKELLTSVLSQHYHTHASRGNFNSNIGLPMSMLEMGADAEAAVFELGMSARFEIEYLTKLVRPDISIITTIGTSHMEALGSRENIAKAKLEILEGMQAGGTILLNGDEPLLRAADADIRSRGIRPIYISVDNEESVAEVRAKNIRIENGRTLFDIETKDSYFSDLCLNVLGKHTVYAAAYAFVVGILQGLSEAEIRSGLFAFRTAPMRQSIATYGGVTVIEDCYNASPESMRAALDVAQTLAKEGGGRVMALLGDMRELGETSPDLHRTVGLYAAEKGVGELFTFGAESSAFLAAGAVDAGIPADHIHRQEDATGFESLGELILSRMRAGDVLLVKASRALRAERVLSYIKEHTVVKEQI